MMDNPAEMSASDELYKLQLQLKQNKVNKDRKASELKRLRTNFEKQVQNIQVHLKASAKAIWTFLNRTSSSTNYISLSNIEMPIFSPNTQQISNYLNELRDNPSQILNDVDPNMECLPESVFITILSLFNFCWSVEQTDAFAAFISNIPLQYQPLVAQCALIQPILQIYFTTCLQPVFDSILTLDIPALHSLLLSSFTSNSALIPVFLSEILKTVQNPSYLFYFSFLKPIIQNFDIFSLAHSELVFFAGAKLNSLLEYISNYFNSKESEQFVLQIANPPLFTSLLPSEDLLLQVYSHYQPMTIFSKDNQLYFAPLSSLMPSSIIEPQHDTNSLSGLVHRFLLRAELVRVEGTFEDPLKYFQQLSTLSSIYGEPKLEEELDQIALALHPNKDPSNTSISISAAVNSNFSNSATQIKPPKSLAKAQNESDVSLIKNSGGRRLTLLPNKAMKPASIAPPLFNNRTNSINNSNKSPDKNLNSNDNSSDNANIVDINGNLSSPKSSKNNKQYIIPSTIHEIVREVEKEFLEPNTKSNNEPLIKISKYSGQYAFLTKIEEIIKKLIKQAQKKVDFQIIKNWLDANLLEEIPPVPENSITNSNDPNLNDMNPQKTVLTPENEEKMKKFTNYFLVINQQIVEAFPEIQSDSDTRRFIHSTLTNRYHLLEQIRTPSNKEKDIKLHDFIENNKQYLLDQQQNSFLQIYKDDPSLLTLFNELFNKAIASPMPFQGLIWLNEAYSVLENLLTMQDDLKEIGADQLLPMSILSMLLCNPLGLHSFEQYLEIYLIPLTNEKSPVEHSVEYSVAQFMSFYHFVAKESNLIQ